MKHLETLELNRPYRFESPFAGAEFAALIVACDPTISHDEQSEISRSIVVQGCRWAVCVGNRASTWDDSIDLAYLGTDKNFEPADSTHVMTTWHDEDSPQEIARFFVNDTSFDHFEARNLLIVYLGCDAEIQETFGSAADHELGLGG